MQRIRGKLTYANVMATIAVFIALGGGAYAIKLNKNSVGTKQLRRAAVTERKLAAAAVTNSKIAVSAVDSTKIADGSVGLSDSNASLHQICRAGTTYLVGACIDNAPHLQDKWLNALADCVSRGGSLPSLEQLALLKARLGADFHGGWTNQSFEIDPDDNNVSAPFQKHIFFLAAGTITPISDAGDGIYRCVFDVTG